MSPQTDSWLFENNLQMLLKALEAGGEEARVVGGAVRNALLGLPISDIDIATTTLPAETAARAQKLGFHAVPTGIDFGTVTVVAKGHPYEVTTLRADVETDGRHAKVHFGRDWKADAERRDFTINALYADRRGRVYDDVGGLQDIAGHTLRFIGRAEDRIREDYLRILRFFRFFAWYGKGRPDAEGLKAAAKLKEGLSGLSAERVWGELKKLLGAPDPARALLWMRQTGVLTAILPETEKWGIDAIHNLPAAEKAFLWETDPLLRLESIVPPDAGVMRKMAGRLKFSNAEKKRLVDWAEAGCITADIAELQLKECIYRKGRLAVTDRLRQLLAAAFAAGNGGKADASRYVQLETFARDWPKPVFPLKGQDMIARGVTKGPEIGRALKKLEEIWIKSGFSYDRAVLLAQIKNGPDNL